MIKNNSKTNMINSVNNSIQKDENSYSSSLFSKPLRYLTGGSLTIEMNNQPSFKISVEKNNKKIIVDLISPNNLVKSNNEIGLREKITNCKDFAHQLANDNITLSILHEGKETIVLGKDAKPSLSKLVTGSKHIQIKSLIKLRRLDKDLMNIVK